jgi:hypothetical protein
MKLGHEAPRKKARNEERCAHEESCRLLKPAAERPPVWRSRFVLEERRRSTRCRTPALATGCLKPLFSYTGTQAEHSPPGRIFFSCRRRLPRTCEGARASRSHAVRSGGAGENGPGGGCVVATQSFNRPRRKGFANRLWLQRTDKEIQTERHPTRSGKRRPLGLSLRKQFRGTLRPESNLACWPY